MRSGRSVRIQVSYRLQTTSFEPYSFTEKGFAQSLAGSFQPPMNIRRPM
jgi:hypothetical protein